MNQICGIYRRDKGVKNIFTKNWEIKIGVSIGVCLMACLSVGPVLAQKGKPQKMQQQKQKQKRGDQKGGSGGGIFRLLDTNRDNALSVNEIAKITVVLAQLDVNRDGVLDAQELDVRGGGQGGKKKKISKK